MLKRARELTTLEFRDLKNEIWTSDRFRDYISAIPTVSSFCIIRILLEKDDTLGNYPEISLK